MTEGKDLRTLVYALDSDEIDIPFWEGCGRGEFLLYRCNICDRYYWPAAMCVSHGGKDMAWVPASGRGIVHDHIALHKVKAPPHLEGQSPFNFSVVKLEEGPFFHSNVIGCAPEEVKSGMPVEVALSPSPGGLTLPLFRPAQGQPRLK